jgi:hypothetical protein
MTTEEMDGGDEATDTTTASTTTVVRYQHYVTTPQPLYRTIMAKQKTKDGTGSNQGGSATAEELGKEIKEMSNEKNNDILEMLSGDVIAPYLQSPTTLPPPDLVDPIFLSMLSAQLIPSHLHSKLLQDTTTQKKWEMILAYSQLISSQDMILTSSFNNIDSNLLHNLQTQCAVRGNPPINMIDILQLKTRICTGNKLWIQQFMKSNGLELLLNLIETCLSDYPFGEYHAALVYELISSLKLILNNGISMNRFLRITSSLRIIISSLMFEWKLLALQVLEILCVLCDYSSGVALEIIQHIKYLSFAQHKLPFEYLIQNLIDCDLDVKASIIQFLNHMVCSVSDIQLRILMRNEIQSLQFHSICEIVLKDMAFEYQQIKTLNPQNVRKSLHHMSSSAGFTSGGSGGSSGTSIQRIKTFFEAHRSAPVMKWIRRKRIKAKHLLTSNSFLLDSSSTSSSPASEPPPFQSHQTISLSSASNQSATPLAYSHFSEDGSTPIRPYLGIMCGTLYVIKNHFSFSDLYHLGTTLKQRYFELLGDHFSWWHLKRIGTDQAPMGSISTSQMIKSIRIHSYNEEINAICPYSFEVVLVSGQIYSYGCSDVLSYNNWLLALNYVFNRNLLLRSSYVLIPKELSTDDFKLAKSKFQKQLTVYQVLDQEDYQKYQLTYGPRGLVVPSSRRGGGGGSGKEEDGIESKEGDHGDHGSVISPSSSSLVPSVPPVTLQLTNYVELMQYLYHNMLTHHLDSYLYTLLQELILVPLGRPYGDIFWKILLSYCQSMRTTRQLLPEMAASLASTTFSKTELLTELNKFVVNNLSLDECLEEMVQLENSSEGKQSHEMRQLVKSLFAKDAEILRLKDEMELLRSLAGEFRLPLLSSCLLSSPLLSSPLLLSHGTPETKTRSCSVLADPSSPRSSTPPTETETRTGEEMGSCDDNEELQKKSVARLVEEFNSSSHSSSPVSPRGTPSTPTSAAATTTAAGRLRHRANPSRDIRVTYLHQIEGKAGVGEIYQQQREQQHQRERSDGSTLSSVKSQRHVSFPQWSTDELEGGVTAAAAVPVTRERKDSSALGLLSLPPSPPPLLSVLTTHAVDLNAQIRSLQQELQQSQFENEKLQQEIRMNKTMSGLSVSLSPLPSLTPHALPLPLQ